jgi:hypothetical protein
VATLPAHIGQPLPFFRLNTSACHSCEGSREHRHQTFLLLPGVTASGVRTSFLSGCHSSASSGRSARNEVVGVATRPWHIGQPVPFFRFETTASHSWEGSMEHSHQTFLWLPGVTASGVRPPFFVGCHSAASSGCVRDKGSFNCSTLRPFQTLGLAGPTRKGFQDDIPTYSAGYAASNVHNTPLTNTRFVTISANARASPSRSGNRVSVAIFI